MFKTVTALLLVLSANMAFAAPTAPNTAYDKAECKRSWENANRYVAEAHSFLWKLHDRGLVDYDAFSTGQNEIINETRMAVSNIRATAYNGEAFECHAYMLQAMNKTDVVLLTFMRYHGLTLGK